MRAGAAVGVVASPGVQAPAAGIQGEYALWDTAEVRAGALVAVPVVDERPVLLQGEVALLYRIDITQWVPYAGLGAGVQASVSPQHVALVLLPQVGVDHLLSRNFSVGAEYRLGLLPSNQWSLSHQVLVHFEHRWGW